MSTSAPVPAHTEVQPGTGLSGATHGLHEVLADFVKGPELRAALSQMYGVTPPVLVQPGMRLPVAGQDAQTVDALVDLANGVVWSFRFTSAIGVPYQWAYRGGSSLRSYVDANENTASTTFADLASIGPKITIPFSGDYDVFFGASPNAGSTSSTTGFMGVSVGGGAPAVPLLRVLMPGSGNINMSLDTQTRLTGVTAGQTITAQYKIAGGGNMDFTERWMTITPIRCAGG